MNKIVILLLLFTTLIRAQDHQWEMINAEGSCTARHECGFVAHKSELYLIGGRGIKPIEKYSISDNEWASFKEIPLEIHHLTPVSFGDKIYVVGGLTGQYPIEQPLTHVYAYDPKSDNWEKLIEIPKDRRRGGGGVAVYKDKIYLINGITNGHTSGTCAMFDVYDPINDTWSTLPDAPHIRDHSNAVVINNILIALGGRNTSYHKPDNFTAFFDKVSEDIDYYDFKNKTWNTYQSKTPAPAAGSGAVVFKKQLYFIGGETGEKVANNQTYAFDPKKDSWMKKLPLKVGRHGTNAVLWDGHIYIAAGSGNQGGGPELNSIEVYK